MVTVEEKKIIDLFTGVLLMENYPPLAGKIIGLFFVTEKKYYTFDEMLEVLDTNKTALSRALKFLGSFNMLSYTYKKNIKRRRYFYLDIPSYIEYIGIFIQSYDKLNTLIKVAQQMRGDQNEEMNTFIEEYVTYNDKVLKSLKDNLTHAFSEYGEKGEEQE